MSTVLSAWNLWNDRKSHPHFDELERWFAERGGKLVDGSDKTNALGIVGGVAPRQRRDQGLPKPNTKPISGR
jgi:hypothetical protein